LGDRELIHPLKSADSAAFEEAVGRWNSYVLSLAYRLIGDRQLAEDIRQDVFVRLWRSAVALEAESSLSTWLYRVTVNRCRDELRSSRSRSRILDVHREPVRLADASGSSGEDRAERSQDIARAVLSLPVAEREAVVLRHYHDLTFSEVAEILGSPVSTVKSRVLSGLRRLAVEFGTQSISRRV
jgi:RNA polymerase sigma-70 factor (ECF subfamily)